MYKNRYIKKKQTDFFNVNSLESHFPHSFSQTTYNMNNTLNVYTQYYIYTHIYTLVYVLRPIESESSFSEERKKNHLLYLKRVYTLT